MCGESFAFWYCVVLFITSSSKTSGNFTSDNKEDNIWEGNIWKTYNYTKFIRSKRNNNNKTDILPYEKCANITCIQLCCPLGDRLDGKNCIASENEYVFPNIYSSNNSIQSGNKNVNDLFPLTVQNPCQETIRFIPIIKDNYSKYYEYMIFANSSLYLPNYDIFLESTSYCLAVVDRNQFDAIFCLVYKEYKKYGSILNEELNFLFSNCHIVSMVCLLTTFVVYSILPELRNIHSLLEYFCFLSSSFWLSVMSFDFWWTFRDFRSLQRNERGKQKRKKLIYSILALGGPFIFIIICIVMEFVPNVPKNLIRPEFCVDTFGFHENMAYLLYFYGPHSVCVVCSFCLSIYTALKIVRYEKDTARHLRDSESRFYNDNKRWFVHKHFYINV
ncbi:G-protein coupled receptor Mth2 [Camponotus floridanus]|uniref:G-protein coupled receptor Mth2 n=1 Tax=Camponotus floridanus TaxID=104421 RepID=E2APM8_CAMFO|nr:G-protein coupled receptor Mth2 [Camponotus floridanus]